MNSKDRMPFDGLSTLNYTLLSREFQRLVTIVHVKVEEINVRTQFLTNQYKKTLLYKTIHVLNLNQRQIEKKIFSPTWRFLSLQQLQVGIKTDICWISDLTISNIDV